MIALTLSDKRTATESLFMKSVFDGFWVKEIELVTGNTYHIDGKRNESYYNTEELEAMQGVAYASWGELRPLCFSLIKGKKLPLKFQITLQYPKAAVTNFLAHAGLSDQEDTVAVLYLHFRYQKGQLQAVTGTALSVFSMDKRVERSWDEQVMRILKKLEIPFE